MKGRIVDLQVSDNAVKRLMELNPEGPYKVLRISVKGGGCSGLRYDLEFTDQFDVLEDQVRSVMLVEGAPGVVIVVDNKSALFLNGCTLDFDGSLNGKGFEVKNPKAKSTCGCGESFSV